MACSGVDGEDGDGGDGVIERGHPNHLDWRAVMLESRQIGYDSGEIERAIAQVD